MTGPSDGYLHRTAIPTYHFQSSLPRLPVPKLDKSLERYAYFAEPLVPAAQLEATRGRVRAFARAEGVALQAELERRAAATYSSFISAPWFDMYLRDRRPLMLNHNPHLGFVDEPGVGRMEQAARAARLIDASVAFYRTLRDAELEPDVFHTKPKLTHSVGWELMVAALPSPVAFYGAAACGAYPLDMSQYGSLFESTRIPRPGRDELRKARDLPTPARHVAVQCGSRFWQLQVVGADGRSLGAEAIERGLREILARSEPPGTANPAAASPPPPPLGALTSLPRDEWAAARAAIEESCVEARDALGAIDSALFAVCLEHAAPEGAVETNRTFLHGDGTNRWFDKSFQLLVCANGRAAVNFEHSWGDGVAVLRYFNEVHAYACALPGGGRQGSAKRRRGAPAPVRELRLAASLPPEVAAAVPRAVERARHQISKNAVQIVESEAIGSAFAKSNALSPDGLMQMTLQLAHHRLHGCQASTYESASTAAFKHGRTETIRAATPESAALCRAFADPASSAAEREAALRRAVDTHSRVTRDALVGNGVDRHLFALRELAAELHGAPPEALNDETYAAFSKIIISTSTLNSDALADGGFGPVNEQCYAAGYGIRPEGCRYVLRSERPDVPDFAAAIRAAQADIREALRTGDPAAAKS